MFVHENIGDTISSFDQVTFNDECALTDAIQANGPISVAIDAAHPTFQFYSSGVYYEPACSDKVLNHGVAIVGFGARERSGVKEDYYIVKNSWGKDWGEEGYIRMSRNRMNNCGIASMASYPIVSIFSKKLIANIKFNLNFCFFQIRVD
jgi:cathepsin L